HRLEQGLDVADLREVVENDRARHEERRRDDGEGLVLVPRRPERALDGMPALDAEPIAGRRLDEEWHGVYATRRSRSRPSTTSRPPSGRAAPPPAARPGVAAGQGLD